MATAIPFTDMSEDTSSTVTPVKASFWTRAKARVVTIAKRIASPIKGAAVAVKTATVKAASATKRTVVKAAKAVKRTAVKVVTKVRGEKSKVPSAKKLWSVRHAATSTKTWIGDTWRRVVRPFLKLRAIAFGIVGLTVALVVAPVTTLIVVFGIGLGLWLLSYGVEYLEASASPAARTALKAIEMIAQFCKGLVFAAVAAVSIFFGMMSIAYAATEVLELVLRYLNVRDAVGISTLAYMIVSGQWLWVAVLALLYVPSLLNSEVLRRRSVDQQDVKPTNGNRRVSKDEMPIDMSGMFDEAMRNARMKREAEEAAAATEFEARLAKMKAEEAAAVAAAKEQTPRRVKLPKCTACWVDDNGSRFAVGQHRGLCEACFKHICEEDVIKAAKRGDLKKADFDTAKAAGVNLPRGRFALSDKEIIAASEAHAYRHDASNVYWIVTAWWRDGRGGQHVREWFGFVMGEHIATIEYRHERHHKGYLCRLLHSDPTLDKRLGVFLTLGRAQEVVGEELSDLKAVEINAAETAAETLGTEAEGFATATEFISPEAHIEHVRRTLGTDAADRLEEQYLSEMIAQGGSS